MSRARPGSPRFKRPRLERPRLAPPEGCDPDSVVLTYPVVRDHAGLRLDRFVMLRIPRLSRTRAQEIIRACAFHADGRRRRPSDIVREGEVVLLVRERFEEPEVPLEFQIIEQDEALLAIDKPAGLPMHPSATYHKHTLSYLLRERYAPDGGFAPQIAHRLDRETSGVVLCALNRQAERRLKMAFEAHRVQKGYVAIVEGELAESSGEITLPLAAVEEGLHVRMEVRDDGAHAHTHYEVVERRAGRTLLALHPRTGRQHQLRVHLSAIGHPIVGDKLYGPEREAPFLEIIERGMSPELLRRLGHPRQALHAEWVQFEHPLTGLPHRVAAPLPPDLERLWQGHG